MDREHGVVSISVTQLPNGDSADSSAIMPAEVKQSVIALLEQMEHLPDSSGSAPVSLNDHDRIIYGIAK